MKTEKMKPLSLNPNRYYTCDITMWANDVLPETFTVTAKRKKGDIYFLNQVAQTIRDFHTEAHKQVGANPERLWRMEYAGSLKAEFMKALEGKTENSAPLTDGWFT